MTNANDLMHDPNIDTSQINCDLTKREYFAAMVMQGILAGYDVGIYPYLDREYLSEQSTMYADALIEQLNKTK